MSDEPSFDFLPWEELPVGIRRNRKKMYNYLVGVLNGGEPGPTPSGPTPPGPTPPGPTPPGPTGTGTVTVTCVDSQATPLSKVQNMLLYTGDVLPTEEDDSMLVATGYNDSGNVVELFVWDTATHRPTEDNQIPFGTYNVIADGEDTFSNPVSYNGSLTVDGNEEITITLTRV